VKRVIFLLTALLGAAAVPAAAIAQSAPNETSVIATAQPAIDALLSALPRDTTLTPTQVFIDGIGQAHVRLAQAYKGVPVFEGDAIIHVDLASGKVIGTTNATLSFAPVNITPSVSAQRAADSSRAHFAQPPGLANKKDLSIIVTGGSASLAWKVHSEGDVPQGRLDTVAFVGAQTGRILRS